jgi:hypothetical protein
MENYFKQEEKQMNEPKLFAVYLGGRADRCNIELEDEVGHYPMLSLLFPTIKTPTQHLPIMPAMLLQK